MTLFAFWKLLTLIEIENPFVETCINQTPPLPKKKPTTTLPITHPPLARVIKSRVQVDIVDPNQLHLDFRVLGETVLTYLTSPGVASVAEVALQAWALRIQVLKSSALLGTITKAPSAT